MYYHAYIPETKQKPWERGLKGEEELRNKAFDVLESSLVQEV